MNRCARCNRPLFATAAVTVKTKDGVRGIGPKCARLMNLIDPNRRVSMQVRRTAEPKDERQMDWIEVAA